MLCPKCQTENPEGAKFCSKCGALLPPGTVEKPINPLLPAAGAFFLGGPITSLVTFLIWRSSWDKSKKIKVNIIFLVVFNIFLLGVIALSGFLGGILLKFQSKSSSPSTINQVTSPLLPKSGFLTPTSSPFTSLPINSKYNLDSDADSIPDFVENATGYDPNKDECLLSSCAGDGQLTGSTQQTNILFILDSSGSMAETAGKEIKMTAAKNALKNLVGFVPKNVNIGLIVYGHKGSNSSADKQISCQGIELLYPLSQLDRTAFTQAIDSFRPTGWTPIGGSLRKTKEAFLGKSGQNNVVFLVTDGLETCESDPSSAIDELRKLDIKPVINIVGFGVTQSESTVLQQLSQLGGGQYFLASDSDKLAEIFANFKKALETLACNQNNSQAYIACVAKRADTATAYLTNLNQSLYLNGQPYQGVQANPDDTHEAISATQTKIIEYKNKAGEAFAKILQQNSSFFGEQYQQFQNR